MKFLITLISFLPLMSFAQEMSSLDNQCRVQAKEIALKTYQTCTTEAKSSRIDQIRKEYQEKITQLKKQYDAQLLEMKNAQNKKALAAPVVVSEAKTEEAAVIPTVLPPENLKTESATNVETLKIENLPENLPVESVQKIDAEPIKADTVEQQDLTLSEPTVTLKPAVAETAKTKKAVKPAPKTALNKNKPVKKQTVARTQTQFIKTVAQKRAKGEKSTKGIAKTLPTKKMPVETKPAAPVVAPVVEIQQPEVETTASANVDTETTDSGLSGQSAEIQ